MTIVLCGGGSGGHITPLLAVATELRDQHPDTRLVYIGEKGGKFTHIATNSKLFDELHFVAAGKLRRYHGDSFLTKLFDIRTNILNIRDLFRLSAGLVQSYFLLRRLKPDAMFLKGGFVCVPVALAARAHHLPYITHDSDALPGLSNRIAARWARYQAVAMPAKYYSYPSDTVRVVGVPTDQRFRPYSESEQRILREKYGIAHNARIVLITGGSNGAQRLNEAMINILPRLLETNPDLYVIHQVGAGNMEQIDIVAKNATLNKRVHFFEFTPELFHMSAIADVVVTRAGATTVADLASQSKACVIVPNPYLTGGHQLKNAKVYADARAATIVFETDILEDSTVLYNAIHQLLHDPEKRTEMGHNLRSLSPVDNTAMALAQLVTGIAQ